MTADTPKVLKCKCLKVNISPQTCAAAPHTLTNNVINSAHTGAGAKNLRKYVTNYLLLFSWWLSPALTLAFGLQGFVWSKLQYKIKQSGGTAKKSARQSAARTQGSCPRPSFASPREKFILFFFFLFFKFSTNFFQKRN